MIKLTSINKYYKSSSGNFHALKDINLNLPDQGMVYIVGKSGSGKSTLLNIIGGIDSFDSGEIIIENNSINENGEKSSSTLKMSEFSKKDYNSYRNTYIGFIFQEFNVIKGLTVYENIALSLELQQISIKDRHQDILDIIEKVGLKGKERRRINELSGGERQRVAIARALIKDPKIIIADEPTGNLDSKNRDIVMDILKKLSKEKLVLIVTHDKLLSKRYGDREIKIKDGQITDDTILNQENLSEIVCTPHELKPITPKAKVSFNLAWKGFKLNLVRFIFIIILFSISLIFAGTVINLYMTDTTKMYAEFQQENGNNVVTLSDKYTYFETDKTTAFFTHNLSSAKRQFKLNDGVTMQTYESMHIDIPISDQEPTDSFEDKFFKQSINYITKYETQKDFEEEFYLLEKTFSVQSEYKCYITDYLAYMLNHYNYYGYELELKEFLGRSISFEGNKQTFKIVGIIETNYLDFYNLGEKLFKNNKKHAVFEDNLALYNSIFVSKTVYEDYFTGANLNYYYDDIIYNTKSGNIEVEDVKFSYIQDKNLTLTPMVKIPGYETVYPKKPEQGEITEIAVSKGFVEKVLNLDVENLVFSDSSKLMLNGTSIKNFYLCGISRIPASIEFNITCIIDDEDIVIYTPDRSESHLYNNLVSSSFQEGGFLTAKISNDLETNSQIYRNLLNNDITINNPSFRKLQLVDVFISDNIFLFAALFFIFCLFSILMIFNFIVINIKNSTRDIGIYMSLGMNGFKIALIYLFQILIVSTIAMLIGIIGSSILLAVVDSSFKSLVIVDFKILTNTFLGVIGTMLLGYLTPIIAIALPLLDLSKKKPIDVIKVS